MFTNADFYTAKRIFNFAVISSIVISAVSLVFIENIYSDTANVYAYYAREFSLNGIASAWVGRVPMFFILISGCLAKIGVEAYRATIIVSSFFYIISIFPLRIFLERFVSDKLAAFGCVLYVFCPKIIRYSVTGVLDPLRIFFLILGLLVFFEFSDYGKFKHAVIFGISMAGLAVSRGEGGVIALFLLAILPFYICYKEKRIVVWSCWRMIGLWILAVFLFFLLIFPFCWVNWHCYRAFVPDVRFIIMNTVRTAQPITGLINESAAESLCQKVFSVIEATSRGAYELYMVFSIIGMIVLFIRKQWRKEYTIFIILYVLHTGIYCATTLTYRYNLYMVPLFMPCTLAGLGFVAEHLTELMRKFNSDYICKAMRVMCICCLFLLLLLQAKNGLSFSLKRVKNDVDYKVAEFIKDAGNRLFPSRRCRLAAWRHLDVVYWSGMEAVFNYRDANHWPDLCVFRDYDFLLLDCYQHLEHEKCPWLKQITLPAELAQKYSLYMMDCQKN